MISLNFQNMENMKKIGFGGGCHWCTEAVFQSLKGVTKVEQGYISSHEDADSFSEAVIVHYEPEIISLQELVSVHIFTHKATSDHSFRRKYRSAIYYFREKDVKICKLVLESLQQDLSEKIITQILPFNKFKASRESLQDYYKRNPDKPFCQKYIHPKLSLLKEKFSELKKEH